MKHKKFTEYVKESDRITLNSKQKKGTGCWLWLRSRRGTGYGQVWFRGTNWFAHRASWEIFKGEIPKGSLVLHSCDTPLCVNPKHLFLGSVADNVKDRDNKKRGAFGERNGRAKITPKDVVKIRKMRRSGLYTLEQIGGLYGLSASHTYAIANGLSWKSVEDAND